MTVFGLLDHFDQLGVALLWGGKGAISSAAESHRHNRLEVQILVLEVFLNYSFKNVLQANEANDLSLWVINDQIVTRTAAHLLDPEIVRISHVGDQQNADLRLFHYAQTLEKVGRLGDKHRRGHFEISVLDFLASKLFIVDELLSTENADAVLQLVEDRDPGVVLFGYALQELVLEDVVIV